MKTIIISLLILLILLSTQLSAQVGTSGLSFLKIGVSARSIAMGDVTPLDKSDPSSIYYNPATMSLSDNSQLMLMHREWVGDTRTEYLGAFVPWGKFRFGIALNLTSVDNLEIRTAPGASQGIFSTRNSAIGLSASYDFENLLIGLTGKFLYEKILIDEASGYGLDFGAIYKTPWAVQLGLSINNIGSMNALRYESSTLPTLIRFGGSKIFNFETINSSVTPAAEIVSVFKEHKTHLQIGSEFCYQNMFSLRTGVQTGYKAKFFSTGVGFKYNIFAIDYAFVPWIYDFGTTHTISVIINL
jgi:hypothetical protein